MNYPSDKQYQEDVESINTSLKEAQPALSTATGSAIRELLVRPMALIFGGLYERLLSVVQANSMEALSTSQATQNPDADRLLGNFFITRQSATLSTATVTVKSTSEVTTIRKGTILTCNGVQLTVKDTYIGAAEKVEVTGALYTRAKLIASRYYFNILVESESATVLPADSEVTGFAGITGVVAMVLSTPLTGGSTAETDAAMVERARTAVASPIGSSRSILQLLQRDGYQIKSARAFGVGSAEMQRDRNNSTLVGVGGCVDVYIQTLGVPLESTFSAVLTRTEADHTVYTTDITDLAPAGFYKVVRVVCPDWAVDHAVTYGSRKSGLSAEDARFSSYQSAQLVFTIQELALQESSPDTVEAEITVAYMPYVEEIQAWADSVDGGLVGLDLLIKAAIPAYVGISSKVVTSDLDQMVTKLTSYINDLGVGNATIKLSDLQDILNSTGSGQFVSPTLLQMQSMPKGDSLIRAFSNNGVIQPIEDPDSRRTERCYFPCTDSGKLTLEQ